MSKLTEHQMWDIADHCIRHSDMLWERDELLQTIRHLRQRTIAAEGRLNSIAEMTKRVDEKWRTLRVIVKQEEI